jgi:hypothetical protein
MQEMFAAAKGRDRRGIELRWSWANNLKPNCKRLMNNQL